MSFDRIGTAIFKALDLDPAHYMKEAVMGGPGHDEARRAMVDLLDYRVIEDLARAWRVAQPNLEQCGLLRRSGFRSSVSALRVLSDVLDLDQSDFPLFAEKAASLELSGASFDEALSACRDVALSAATNFEAAPWFSEAWLHDTLRDAASTFDAAFRRWRELYRAAVEQREAARRKIDSPRMTRRDREAAEQQEREAKREIELLLNRGGITESDFYTYRYLANEGFIPGYNFPRLPLRALVTKGDEAHAIDRARFIGLAEFGPGNVVYHEGRKHRIVACALPAGGIETRLTLAKLCRRCGYIHPGEEATVDLCVHCGTRLDGDNSEFPQALFDQPTVRARRWARVSSEEEERVREGYQMIYQVEEQEVAVELIGREENQRILLWEAAEGGIGLWERLVSEKDAFAELARCAISIIHCDASTGADLVGWTDRCTAACYDCLL